jgi:hypothetical protein
VSRLRTGIEVQLVADAHATMGLRRRRASEMTGVCTRPLCSRNGTRLFSSLRVLAIAVVQPEHDSEKLQTFRQGHATE